MRCEEIMKTEVECLDRKSTARDAARRMRDENVGFLPVCDDQNKVLGTLTDRDLTLRVLADEKATSTRCTDIMTREVVSCRPGDDLRRAEELMAKHRKSRILCLDEQGRLVGVISPSDLAQRDRTDSQVASTLRSITEREATT